MMVRMDDEVLFGFCSLLWPGRWWEFQRIADTKWEARLPVSEFHRKPRLSAFQWLRLQRVEITHLRIRRISTL